MTRDNRLLSLSLLLWGIGEGLTYYIRPLYLKELGANPVAIGTILGLAAMASAVTHIPAGYLADRFGRKQLLLAGWVLGVLAAIIMYLARDLGMFVVGLLAYTFTSFVLAPIHAYAVEARGSQSVQRAVTLVSAGFWAGNAMSPALGGVIGQIYGLRTVYGLAVIAFTLSTLALLPLTSQAVAPPEAGASRYGRLLRNRRFLGFLGLIFFAIFAIDLGRPFAPNFVVEARGYDVAVVGVFGTITSLGAVALNVTLGQRLPRRGFIIAQAAAALYVVLLLSARQLSLLGVAFFFQAGWNLAHSLAVAQVGRVVDNREIGLALGMTETLISASMIFASFFAGVFYASDPALPFQTSLAAIAVMLPLVWLFAPRRDAYSEEPVVLPITSK